jgi:hypothetical protein
MGKLTSKEKESILKFLKTNLENNPLVKDITIKESRK